MGNNSEFGWYFDQLGMNSTRGIPDGMKFFQEKRYSAITREVLQNSLDARVADSNEPVKVIFETIDLDKGDIFFTGLKEVIDNCYRSAISENWAEEIQNFYEIAVKEFRKPKIPCLKISDFGTKGLTDEDWERLRKGTSRTAKDITGGSKGIGHTAPFNISNLYTLIYETVLEDQSKKLGGKSLNISSQTPNGQKYDGQGFYGQKDEDDRVQRIDTNELDTIATGFRTEIGTTLWILGFSGVVKWENRIRLGVLRNYFTAVYRGELVVEIPGLKAISNLDTQTIAAESMKSHFEECIELLERDKENPVDENLLKDLHNSFCYFLCLDQPDNEVVEDLKELGKCRFSIKLGEDFPNSVADTRNGILIREKDSHRMRGSNFVVVFEPLDAKGISKLRSFEPPAHDNWSSDDDEKKTKLLNKILREKRHISSNLVKEYSQKLEDTQEAFNLELPIGDSGKERKPKSSRKSKKPTLDYRWLPGKSTTDLELRFSVEISMPRKQNGGISKDIAPQVMILKETLDSSKSPKNIEVLTWQLDDGDKRDQSLEFNEDFKGLVVVEINEQDRDKVEYGLELKLEDLK